MFSIFLEEPSFGIYYTQLGYARTMPEIRAMMERRTGVTGKAVRIEHAVYCMREGKSKTGCPVAKEVSPCMNIFLKLISITFKLKQHLERLQVIKTHFVQ